MSLTTQLTEDILIAISERYHPRCHVFRINVFVAMAKRGPVRSAPNGTADLMGCIRGLPVAIEIKRNRDTKRDSQKLFSAQWSVSGGLYVVARNVEDCMSIIDREICSREGF